MLKVYYFFLLIPCILFSQNIKYIQPDDYEISNAQLQAASKSKHVNNIYLDDVAWFTNDSLKQSILVWLYTDYHRLRIAHFKNDTIPDSIIKCFEFQKKTNKNSFDTILLPEKRKNMSLFLKQATPLPAKYFVSKHALKLGLSKADIISKCGAPHKMAQSKGLQIFTYNYIGDKTINNNTLKLYDTIAENSFGYTLTLFLKNNKLLAILIDNDIP